MTNIDTYVRVKLTSMKFRCKYSFTQIQIPHVLIHESEISSKHSK